MREIRTSTELIAGCGLYCGACRSYLKGKCEGCRQNGRAGWCKIRTCCAGKHIQTCAGCVEFRDPKACKKFNSVISRILGLLFRSDRAACIAQIRRCGMEGHARIMAEGGCQTIKPHGT